MEELKWILSLKHGKKLTKEEIKSIIEKNNVHFIRLQFVDINGNVKNIAVPAAQIDKVLNNECMLVTVHQLKGLEVLRHLICTFS